ncbi:MAG: C-terminal target protein [Ignavibacteria bacterium]|nr:C-terminal target protein [Ignavibacteria bacterium]
MKIITFFACIFLLLFSNSTFAQTGFQLKAWGSNNYGQLGDGTQSDKSSPIQIGNGTNWTSISGGGAQHTLAIKSDGTLWAWGGNAYGQLGDGTITDKNTPVQIGSGTNWVKVSCGGAHTLAIKSDGTLWAWGRNIAGQLGDGTTTDKSTPVQIGTGTNWVVVSCAYGHTLAIKNDGTLWAWGWNIAGQLGDGTLVNKSSPVRIGSGTNWALVSCRGSYTLAIKSDGTLWAWGDNDYGQLGDGTIIDRISPVQIGSGTNWETVYCGGQHTLAIKTEGTLWAWGENNFGKLGDGTSTQRNAPVQIGSGTNWLSVTCGDWHTIAIKNDGTLWAWGNNSYGQLGDGTTTNQNSPVQIGTGTNWSYIVTGGFFNLGLTNISISTGMINGNGLYRGNNLNVTFNVVGTFNTNNTFTAQLSSANGSFANSVNIGTYISTSSSTINCTVPANTSEGTGYRIRVVSSDPVVIGGDNGNDITILGFEISTTQISNITLSSALSGGNINNYGSDITARGVCWNTSGNPTISDNHTTNGSGSGTFTSNITSISYGNTYFVRAYATKEIGIGYGNQVTFYPYNSDNFYKLTFQGVITDNSGNYLSSGNYSLTFRIYNVSEGGSVLWNETQTVALDNGLFNIYLGSVNPLNLPFNTSYYLGITVAEGNELSPRTPLTGPIYQNGGFGR